MAAASLITIQDVAVTFKLTSDAVGTPIDYKCQVTTASLDATANTNPVDATFCAPATTDVAPTSFVLNLTYYQDWGNAESLSQFLFDNDAQLADFEIDGLVVAGSVSTPVAASGQVKLQAGAYGGAAGAPLTATVALPCQGKPTIAPGTPLATASATAGSD